MFAVVIFSLSGRARTQAPKFDRSATFLINNYILSPSVPFVKPAREYGVGIHAPGNLEDQELSGCLGMRRWRSPPHFPSGRPGCWAKCARVLRNEGVDQRLSAAVKVRRLPGGARQSTIRDTGSRSIMLTADQRGYGACLYHRPALRNSLIISALFVFSAMSLAVELC